MALHKYNTMSSQHWKDWTYVCNYYSLCYPAVFPMDFVDYFFRIMNDNSKK